MSKNTIVVRLDVTVSGPFEMQEGLDEADKQLAIANAAAALRDKLFPYPEYDARLIDFYAEPGEVEPEPEPRGF